MKRLAERGLSTEVLTRHAGPLGPGARAHADRLRAIGVLDRSDDQQEMLVICAGHGGFAGSSGSQLCLAA